MRERILRRGVNLHGALKQKDVIQTDVKQELGEFRNTTTSKYNVVTPGQLQTVFNPSLYWLSYPSEFCGCNRMYQNRCQLFAELLQKDELKRFCKYWTTIFRHSAYRLTCVWAYVYTHSSKASRYTFRCVTSLLVETSSYYSKLHAWANCRIISSDYFSSTTSETE
jgi:hypothetical protein